tara:strand:+ start:308 stop:577 length:270 start_codon:yes stop_codon:yes gene_type:complete
MEVIIHTLITRVPNEVLNIILYKYKGLTHPTALIIKDTVKECKQYIDKDSGGWESFITFLSYYDQSAGGSRHKIQHVSLKYYIYGLNNW